MLITTIKILNYCLLIRNKYFLTLVDKTDLQRLKITNELQ